MLSLCAIGLVLTACSGSDDNASSGGGSYDCHEVGYKACPKDDPATQADIDGCNKCKDQLAALEACAGPTTCGADDKKESIDANKCPNETAAVLQCALGK